MIRPEDRVDFLQYIYDNDIKMLDINSPYYYTYYQSVYNDFYNSINGYNYPKKSAHLNYIKTFTFGKLLTYTSDILSNNNDVLRMLDIDEKYNEVFHKTELDTVTNNAEVSQFQDDTEDDGYPNWVYNTQLDDRVRRSHRTLEGMVASKDHDVWNYVMPGVDWGCRCFITSTFDKPWSDARLQQIIDGRVASISNAFDENNVNDDFRFNPYNEDYILPPDHTYIKNFENSKYKETLKEFDKKWKNNL